MQGNIACAEAAIIAGCRFFAGYPITPSTDIAEALSFRMPQIGGHFIQMEDEIAAMGATIGASLGGLKAMTATSGPGFSLKQENIGFASMAEIPCVIVNVQRGGPSTGLPTKISQSDTMQARWGTHGDYTAIAVAASSVQESYDITIRAFELAERYSTPVVLLMDELIAHMREKVILHQHENKKPVTRAFPKVPFDWYVPYKETADLISHPAPFGEGYRYNMTGLTHDVKGFPTAVASEIKQRLDVLRNKIMTHRQEIWKWEEYYTTDARYLILAYGSAARAARGAIEAMRKKKIKVGMFELKTVWPFPYEPFRKIATDAHVKVVIVAENNMGQLIYPAREALPHKIKVMGVNRYDGHALEPQEVVSAVKEEIYG